MVINMSVSKKKTIKTTLLVIIALVLATIAIVTSNRTNNKTIKDEYIQVVDTTNAKTTTMVKETTTKEVESETTILVVETTTNVEESETIDEESTKRFSIFNTTTKYNSNVFYYDDGEVVYINAEEYYTICGIVMNEGGADYASYEGKVALAQCIRNQIIREKHKGNPYDIASIRRTYQEHYTKTPSDEVRRAVTDVFYNHIVVTKEPIIAWCATGYASAWHNQQVAVCSYDGNTFYKLAVKDW